MLEQADVVRIVNGAALAALKTIRPSRVLSLPALDSDGREALHVTIVLPNKSPAKIDGKMALDTIVNVQRDLSAAGEDRFAIIDFVTEAELQQDGGS